MFIGYQNERIVFASNSEEEVRNLPCVVFDRIEETSEEYVLKNGEYVLRAVFDAMEEEEGKLARISELKRLLTETDYVVIKLAEDEASREEYADILAQRKLWRAEINELEG
jgi:hypothetical protein